MRATQITPKISHVTPKNDFILEITFENGEQRRFSLAPYLDKGVFKELRNEKYFYQVRNIIDGIAWPHEQDLSADTLYFGGKQLP